MHATANRPTLRFVLGGFLALCILAALWWQRRSQNAALPDPPGAGHSGAAAGTAALPGSERTNLPGGIAVQAGAPSALGAGGPDPSNDPVLRRERLRLAEERLQTYRTFAKYPPASRPARENPDQLHPTAPVVRTIPLSLAGQPSDNIGLKLRQDRLAVVGGETIELGIRCEDSQSQTVPCAVESALASALPTDSAPPPGQRPVAFLPDKSPGHEGELVATLRPLDLRLVDRTWPLRIDVKLRAGSEPVEQGAAVFDFLFTPDPPAVTTGKIREALVDGSLLLYYGLNVRRAGRYVLHARVDDAAGKEFAFLEWNDLLPTGPQEIKLVIFGKLVLDEHPRMPLKVRDLDGFLLKEQGDPDRESIPSLSGYHYTTQQYPSTSFSAREWQSEERARHEREFERDVDDARK